jgi:hypothetical protein
MPKAIYSAKVEEDGRVRVIHIFLGPNEQECEKLLEKHAKGCLAYGPAVEKEKTIDIVADVDELPEADEQSLEEFLQLDGDDEDEEEDGEEETVTAEPDPEAEEE